MHPRVPVVGTTRRVAPATRTYVDRRVSEKPFHSNPSYRSPSTYADLPWKIVVIVKFASLGGIGASQAWLRLFESCSSFE